MVYYLKYIGTNIVYFEEEDNFLNALKRVMELSEARAKEGIDINVKVGRCKLNG